MSATNEFFLWYYVGLGGIGGWLLFFLLALAAVIFVMYDSQKRRLPATGWRMGVILVALLILPTILYRFTVTDPTDVTSPLAPYVEIIFYLGLLGGILPPLIAVGYYVTFQGMMVCEDGHLYEAALGNCPDPSHVAAIPQPQPYPSPVPEAAPSPMPSPGPAPGPPPAPKAQAWLVAQDGHNYQLNMGETTLGRSSQNDIKIGGDSTVSRQHAKIIEQNNHFKLIDLGSANATRVNDRIVRQPVMLEQNDIVQLGENTVMRFMVPS